ncbi:hypothetical protein ACMGDM_20470 [Sphingomonas sp. DT-51]|uniref:hypothetical protein n=1 Tax=Sphingomonas sp. DT-51 TaxID=3396165 RepID=UPI003F1AFB3C
MHRFAHNRSGAEHERSVDGRRPHPIKPFAEALARMLIGVTLLFEDVAGDPPSHSFADRGQPNAIMFGQACAFVTSFQRRK